MTMLHFNLTPGFLHQRERSRVNAARWAVNNPEKSREVSRKADAKRRVDPEKARARMARFLEENPTRAREWHLKKLYNITLEEYDRMFEEQKGLCGICHKPETGVLRGKVKPLAVDHKGTLGQPDFKVRGLLCGECNMGIGQLHHDPQRLKSAIAWVEK